MIKVCHIWTSLGLSSAKTEPHPNALSEKISETKKVWDLLEPRGEKIR